MRSILFLLLTGHFALAQTTQEHILYFDSNAFLLTETQKSAVNSLFSSEENAATHIVVLGFCDDVGSEEANRILSQKRAKEVTDFLQDGLQVNVSNSIGKGEIALPSTPGNLEETRKNNRIVKIIYSKETEAAKSLLRRIKHFRMN